MITSLGLCVLVATSALKLNSTVTRRNSLAEFATTTALMATLAASGAPKLSEMSEGAKAEKSRNEIDKLIKQAWSYYQDRADTEGRGRFPGQSKFTDAVGHAAGTSAYSNADKTAEAAATASLAHTNAIETDLGLSGDDGWHEYNASHLADWASVFGTTNADKPLPADAGGVNDNDEGTEDWKNLFGDEVLSSTFEDGHYVYSVVAGGGSGNDVYPPVLYVADIKNAVNFNNVLEP